MVADDGDVIRGLGFVSMYSAWVEEEIDKLLFVTEPIEPFDEKKQRWPISRKLDSAIRIVGSLGRPELDELLEALKAGFALFEQRNEVIHGRIYSGFEKGEFLKSGRPNTPTRKVSSAELYALANDFFNYRAHLFGPQIFRLPRAVSAAIKNIS